MFLLIDIGFFSLALLIFAGFKLLKQRRTSHQQARQESTEEQQATYSSDYAEVTLSGDTEQDTQIGEIHTEEMQFRTFQAALDYSLHAEQARLNATVWIVQGSLLSAVLLAYITTRLHWTQRKREGRNA